MRLRTLLLLLAVGLLVTAGPAFLPASRATAAQEDTLGRMVDEIAAEVESLRGWTFKRPVKRQRTSLEQAKRDLRRNIDKALPPARRQRLSAFLATAGLVPADHDITETVLTLLEQQVAGYYEPETGTLHIVRRQDDMPAFVERMVLAHELTHALDDQYGDIGSLTGKPDDRTEDMDIVVTSVAEGSATALMMQHMLRAQAAGRVDPAALTQYVGQETERAKAFERMPRYFSAMFGSYIVGAAFLAGGNLASIFTMPDNRVIGERFLAARRALPRSSEQILHPEKYWEPARRDEPVTADDGAIEKWLARPGRWVVHRDTLGELLTAILTQPRGAVVDASQMQAATAWTNAGAAGWDGDRFYLLASGASLQDAERSLKDLAGVWLTTWDTAADRDEFAAALAKGSAPRGYALVPFGTTGAAVFVNFDAAEREALARSLKGLGNPFH